MSGLPQFLEECPDYRWNPKTQMFEALLYRFRADGVREDIIQYSIRPHTYLEIIKRMQRAADEYAAHAPAEVVELKKARRH